MTTLLLIRHAHVAAVGQTLAGRQAGIRLTSQGQREAEALARWLQAEPLDRVVCSPLERARETAARIAQGRNIEVEIAAELNEFDFGEWTGQSFVELADDPLWQRFNAARSGAWPPGGETMLDVQARATGYLLRLHAAWPQAAVAIVTHGDVIRAALCYFLGVPLDLFARMQIDPASLSTVALVDGVPTLLHLNLRPSGP